MLWICDACTSRYSVGAPRCPECGATAHHDDGAIPEATLDSAPAHSATKAEWVAYAGRLGLVESAAEDLTKADLIDVLEAVAAGDAEVTPDGLAVLRRDG